MPLAEPILFDHMNKPIESYIGIANRLMDEIFRICTIENLKGLMFNANQLDADLMRAIDEHKSVYTVRGDDSDWSVYRVNFRD